MIILRERQKINSRLISYLIDTYIMCGCDYIIFQSSLKIGVNLCVSNYHREWANYIPRNYAMKYQTNLFSSDTYYLTKLISMLLRI